MPSLWTEDPEWALNLAGQWALDRRKNKKEIIFTFLAGVLWSFNFPSAGGGGEAGKSATIFGIAGLPDCIYFCSCTSWEEIRRIVKFPAPGCKLIKRWREH